MDTLNTVLLGLVGLLCAGFVLLVIASALGWKITGTKIIRLTTAPFRFLFAIIEFLPYLIMECFGFLSRDTLRGIRIARKEVKLGILLYSIVATSMAIGLSFLAMAITKFYTGKYFLIDFFNAKEGATSETTAWLLLMPIFVVISLIALNLPRRFCRSDRHFELDAENMKESKRKEEIIGAAISALFGFVIFPPIGFCTIFEMVPKLSYFSVMKNQWLREKLTLEEIEKEKTNRPEYANDEGMLRFLVGSAVERQMRLNGVRKKYFYELTYSGILTWWAWIVLAVTITNKLL